MPLAEHKAIPVGVVRTFGRNVHPVVQHGQNVYDAHVAANVAAFTGHDDIENVLPQLIRLYSEIFTHVIRSFPCRAGLFAAEICLDLLLDGVVKVGLYADVLARLVQHRHNILMDADAVVNVRPLHELCLQPLEVFDLDP